MIFKVVEIFHCELLYQLWISNDHNRRTKLEKTVYFLGWQRFIYFLSIIQRRIFAEKKSCRTSQKKSGFYKRQIPFSKVVILQRCPFTESVRYEADTNCQKQFGQHSSCRCYMMSDDWSKSVEENTTKTIESYWWFIHASTSMSMPAVIVSAPSD